MVTKDASGCIGVKASSISLPLVEGITGITEAITETISELAGYYAGFAAAALADGPLPFVDIAAIGAAALITLFALGYSIYQVVTPSISLSKSDEKEKIVTQSVPIYIYRHNGTNPGNLVPSVKDVEYSSGLSFSTIPMANSWQTTIDAVNATGILFAVKDGKYHVSIYPIGGSVADWRRQGVSSIWTQTLLRICNKVRYEG